MVLFLIILGVVIAMGFLFYHIDCKGGKGAKYTGPIFYGLITPACLIVFIMLITSLVTHEQSQYSKYSKVVSQTITVNGEKYTPAFSFNNMCFEKVYVKDGIAYEEKITNWFLYPFSGSYEMVELGPVEESMDNTVSQ